MFRVLGRWCSPNFLPCWQTALKVIFGQRKGVMMPTPGFSPGTKGREMVVFQIWTRLILPDTNIAPNNGGVQKKSPFPRVYFQGLC